MGELFLIVMAELARMCIQEVLGDPLAAAMNRNRVIGRARKLPDTSRLSALTGKYSHGVKIFLIQLI
jgi:hypothetical protein